MIKREELEHLANLARIKLSEDDKTALIKEFDSILGYIDQLKKVNVKTDEQGRVGAVKNVFRGDVPHPGENREELLAEVPERVGDFVAVKKIIEQ